MPNLKATKLGIAIGVSVIFIAILIVLVCVFVFKPKRQNGKHYQTPAPIKQLSFVSNNSIRDLDLQKGIQEVLDDIVELGYVSVLNRHINKVVLPQNNVFLGTAWGITLKYIAEYAKNHQNFHGEFFVCIYDGWKEYTDPILDPSKRVLVPWLSMDRKERINNYIGVGSKGEPRFRTRSGVPLHIYPTMPLPVLAYARHIGDTNVLLLPDREFFQTHQFSPFTASVASADKPFNTKKSKIFWKGSQNTTPGYSYCAANPSDPIVHPRHAVIALSQKPQLRDVLDASFDKASISDFLEYKYQLDLDGMVGAWSAGYWKLLSNSVVIKPPSHWEHWYSNRLVSGQHFVPMTAYTVQAVLDSFTWCEMHQDQCEKIIKQATNLVNTLSHKHAVEEYFIW